MAEWKGPSAQGEGREGRGKEVAVVWEGLHPLWLVLKMGGLEEGGSYKPKNVGSLETPRATLKRVLPWRLRKGMQSA